MSKRKKTTPRSTKTHNAPQRPLNVGYITPPQSVQSAIVHRTIGSDIEFGRCVHALQMLPNQSVLLLVTDEAEEPGVAQSHTFLLGEEVTAISVVHIMADAKTDDDSVLGET